MVYFRPMKKGTQIKIKSSGETGKIVKWLKGDDECLVDCMPAWLGYVKKSDVETL